MADKTRTLPNRIRKAELVRKGGAVTSPGLQIAFAKKQRRNKMEERRKEVDKVDSFVERAVNISAYYKSLLIINILAIISIILAVCAQSMDNRKYAALHNSQAQTISAQEKIIEVQEGLINGLVLENNKFKLESEDYRQKWLDSLED